MGNHEFCPDCHENDFHLHRPCDPVKVARINAEKAEAERIRQEGVSLMEVALHKAGIKYKLDEYGNAIVSYSQFK